ncbi:hypothetical protein [Clostridium manihotivorum]|uniref:Spore germination protein N-terminal domain-containing protein n=1 Tax=Clostridium manihotivorum TaxID=2320868 RepID=A0A3R5QSC9_9CLOT|nr:hypothetical protein [Clostridium manihotivorum]QAA31395.1 hypothetical protein C1I91_06910 [Clostridium manihotivorum]
MKIFKFISILLILSITLNLTSCWNYREIESMSVVSGVAIDKVNSGDEYELTVEIIKIKAEKTMANKAEYITLTGKSMFDIARNMITVNNKKLYWSHAKCIIISESIARDGVSDIIDWFVRDAEIRTDMYLLVSGEKTAKEILTSPSRDSKIISLDLANQLKNEKNSFKSSYS